MSGTVYTVASGKGGVGKTTTSVNLAVALWQEGRTVGLIDADIGMANLAAVLNIQPEATLHDVLAGRATVDEAIVEAQGGNLLVLPGDRELQSFADADPRRLRDSVDELADRCDYVIVDTGAGLSYEDVLPLGMARGVLLVTTPDPAAFGDTRKTMEVADLLGAPIRGLVVTRAVDDTDAAAIAGEIGAELLGTIPEDPAVMASTVAGNPLESHAPDSEAAAAYRDVAATLLAGDEEWLEANPREPARAPIGEPDSAASAESDDGSGDSGLEAGEAWAAANEDAVGAEEATDIGDLMVEPGEADEPRDDRGRTPSGGQPVGEPEDDGPVAADGDAGPADEPARLEPTPTDVDEPAAGDSGSIVESDEPEEDDLGEDRTEPEADPAGTDEPAEEDEAAGEEADEAVGADRTEAAASRADASSDPGGEDADEGEVEDPDDGGAAEESMEPDEALGQDEEAPDERPEDGAEAFEGAEEGADEEAEVGDDEEAEAPDEPDDADDEALEDAPEEAGADDGDVAAESEGGEEAEEADDSGAEPEPETAVEESEEPEKRGGIRGWLGRLF